MASRQFSRATIESDHAAFRRAVSEHAQDKKPDCSTGAGWDRVARFVADDVLLSVGQNLTGGQDLQVARQAIDAAARIVHLYATANFRRPVCCKWMAEEPRR